MAPSDPGLARKLGFPLSLLKQVCFGARQQNGVLLGPVTLKQVYKRIRLEAGDALRDAIRQETARDLIEGPAKVRERVTDALKDHVGRSLSIFGLSIKRVVSVECVSPEYNRMIIERGRINLRREKIADDRKLAGIEKDELDTETQRFQDQVRHQNDRQRFSTAQQGQSQREQLAEYGETKEVEDQVQSEAMRRRLKREAEEADHLREQQLRNADVDAEIRRQQELSALEIEERRIELQQTKVESAVKLNLQYEMGQHRIQQDSLDQDHRRQIERLEIEFQQQMDSNAAEMNNRIQFLEKFAGLSEGIEENKLLVMALASNPALAKPYVEATRAKGKDELVSKMEDFKNQLVAVHGQEDKLMHQLWQEGVKQIGQILTKQAEKPSTNVLANKVQVTDN